MQPLIQLDKECKENQKVLAPLGLLESAARLSPTNMAALRGGIIPPAATQFANLVRYSQAMADRQASARPEAGCKNIKAGTLFALAIPSQR